MVVSTIVIGLITLVSTLLVLYLVGGGRFTRPRPRDKDPDDT